MKPYLLRVTTRLTTPDGPVRFSILVDAESPEEALKRVDRANPLAVIRGKTDLLEIAAAEILAVEVNSYKVCA